MKSIVGAVYDRAYFVDLGRMNGERHSPPGIGGVDATSRRSREASFDGADGVVKDGTSSKERILKHFGNPNHPVCAAKVASHLFLDRAATPLEEVAVSDRFHTIGILATSSDVWHRQRYSGAPMSGGDWRPHTPYWNLFLCITT